MLSRLRLPANQFSKYLVRQLSRTVHGVYTTTDMNFQPSKVLQRKQFGKFIEGTRDFRLPPRFKTNASIKTGNSKTENLKATRSLLCLKNIEITQLLDKARREDVKSICTTPLSMIRRPISKMSAIRLEEAVPPEEVETELYDVQYIMDPSYQELLYQETSKTESVTEESFNTSGPIIWNLIR